MEFPGPWGKFPEDLSQAILVGISLVGRLEDGKATEGSAGEPMAQLFIKAREPLWNFSK